MPLALTPAWPSFHSSVHFSSCLLLARELYGPAVTSAPGRTSWAQHPVSATAKAQVGSLFLPLSEVLKILSFLLSVTMPGPFLNAHPLWSPALTFWGVLPPSDLLSYLTLTFIDQYVQVITISGLVKVHHLTLNDKLMLFCSRKRFQTLSIPRSRFRNKSHPSCRMKHPSTGCHVSNTSLKRRSFLCTAEKSENPEFPWAVISTPLVTKSSFLRYSQVGPFFSLFPVSFMFQNG